MSRNAIFFTLLLAFVLISQTGCDDPPDEATATFVLDVKAMVDDDPFVMAQTYQNVQDYKFNLVTLRFYLSHLTLVKTDGNEVEVKDVEYLRFENNHATNNPKGEQVSGTIPAGSYSAMRFAIGVDSILNHSDPSQYPSSHPLSIYSGSHWDWNPGYIFLKLEGSIDTIPNGSGTLDEGFLYHTGLDTLYRELQFEDDFTVSPDETFEYKLKLDINRLFYNSSDTLDAANENFTHTIGNFTLAERVTNFLAGALSKR